MPNRPRKFVFTYKDIVKIKRIDIKSVRQAVSDGDFNPDDLASLTRYVYADMIRDLKQTLTFWKKKAKGER